VHPVLRSLYGWHITGDIAANIRWIRASGWRLIARNPEIHHPAVERKQLMRITQRRKR
jgi:hypothetical protein